MSMLRTLDRRGTMSDVVHIHSAPTMEAAIFREERLALAARHSGLRLVENFDDQHGILDVDRLTDVCRDWDTREAWVCGPAPMLAAAERRWENAQLCEKAPPRAVLRRTHHVGRRRAGHLRSSGKAAAVDGATTLLEAGEAAGIQMPFGCRMGICHTCIVPLKKGMVKDLRNGADTTRTPACRPASRPPPVIAYSRSEEEGRWLFQTW